MATIVLKNVNTDVLPVIDVDCYGGLLSTVLEDVFVYDFVEVDNLTPDDLGQEEYEEAIELINEKYDGTDEFWSQTLRLVPDYIQDSFDEYNLRLKVLPGTCKWYHPREYNFSSDAIDFDVEVDTDWVAETFAELSQQEDFKSFLKKRFSSRSGFISFIPDNTADFEELTDPSNDDYWKLVSAIVTYYVDEDPSIARGVTEDLVEYINGNHEFATFSSCGIF